MAELKTLGKEQTRTVWARHGMKDLDLFGVPFGDLEKIRKRIKQDHPLAIALWSTGNCDARHLATMIVDPNRMTAKDVDQWARDTNYRMMCAMVASVIGRSRFGQNRAEKWMTSKREWLGTIGWNMVAGFAMQSDDLDDDYFEAKLDTIEAQIHNGKNFTKEGMNNALIAIGGRNPRLRDLALTAADRIGKVEVDHGLTQCKTPLARPYIEKMWARKVNQQKTAANKTTKKASTKKKTVTKKKTARARR